MRAAQSGTSLSSRRAFVPAACLGEPSLEETRLDKVDGAPGNKGHGGGCRMAEQQGAKAAKALKAAWKGNGCDRLPVKVS